MAMKQRRAIFLDKDGTLVANVPYNVNPARVALTCGAGPALERLAHAGFLLIVVSNQGGIALGKFSARDLVAVEERIQALLQPCDVAVDAFYYCPHLPNGTVDRYAKRCRCRKPHPGMLLRAAAEWNIDLESSWVIGDILDDVEAGRRAGCSTMLIVNGNETEWRPSPARVPHAYATNLMHATRLILAAEARARSERPSAREIVDAAELARSA
jgi:D,D-heptose 1,7-bisphosphate phosphatase